MGGARSLKVLVSAESFLPAVNGVTNSVVRVLEHLVKEGHRPVVVAPRPGRPTVDLPSGATVDVHRVWGVRIPRCRSVSLGVAATSPLRRLLRDTRPDVVHLAAPVVLGNAVSSVASELGVRQVALFQTDLSGFITDYGLGAAAEPVWNWLRRVHNRADLTLAPTPTIAAELRRRHFERVAVWGRGVDHDQFSPARRSAEFRASCCIGRSTRARVLVGYVGRLATEKRVDRLRVLADDPTVQLVIVGDGAERRRLQALLPTAHFTGFLCGDELGTAMASLDVFVHTGEHETFGQTLQEAMACGVPVVAPAAGGPLDLVEHGVNGYLYPPDAASVLARYVDRLTVDGEHRARLGANGRRSVAARSWELVGQELIGHYRCLLDGASTAA